MDFLTPVHLVIILVAFMVLFGAKKLPDAARSLGQSMRIFKAETKGLRGEEHEAAVHAAQAAAAAPIPAPAPIAPPVPVAPTPQYQQPAPQYQQPQYAAPAPQYQQSAPQPQYQQPAPQYQQPQYAVPQPQYQQSAPPVAPFAEPAPGPAAQQQPPAHS